MSEQNFIALMADQLWLTKVTSDNDRKFLQSR